VCRRRLEAAVDERWAKWLPFYSDFAQIRTTGIPTRECRGELRRQGLAVEDYATQVNKRFSMSAAL
jgi:hypothetical protein